MEIQNLLNKLKSSKTHEEPEKFLALEITDTLVQAAVWQVKNAATEVVSRGTIEQWDIDAADDEGLLQAVDKTITKACAAEGYEPESVIFGIPHHWLKGEKIDSPYIDKLKKISQEMALKPLGFVMILESLIRYLRIKEGVPATAIFLHVEESQINASMVRLGKISDIQTVGRSEDICQDLEEALSRFSDNDNFPARIIVFDGVYDIEEIEQNLNSYDWQSKFPFLHLPKIESFDKNVVVDAICIGGGSEVAKSIGFDIQIPENKEPENSPEPKPHVTTHDDSNVVPVSDVASLGFHKDVDVRQSPPDDKEETAVDELPTPKTAPPVQAKSTPRLPSFSMPAISLSKLRLPRLTLPAGLPKLPLFLGLAGLLLLGGLIFAFLWKIPKAQLTLFIEPKNLEESLELQISESATGVDKDNLRIPGKFINKQAEGKESANTTGDKTVGDQATGEVTIYNRTSLPKTFEAGTLISAGDLEFTLDSDVTIASETAGTISNNFTDTPGKATVSVTADQIGTESNLNSGTQFTVANFSNDSFVAVNDASFTGGSSRQVRVVAESDRNNLRKTLIDRLTKEVTDSLQSEIGSDMGVLVSEDAVDVLEETYSAKVGDEADSLTLDSKVELKVLAYQKNDIETLISQSVESRIPPGFERSDIPIEVETSPPTQSEDGSYVVNAKIKVKLLPKINLADLQANLKSKGAAELEGILKAISGFTRAEIAIQPKWLPPRLQKLPSNPKNILIDLKAVE